jgi:DNA-directed RNA polymerase subunit RPC12/RpoP
MGDARQDVISTDGDRFVTDSPMFGKYGRQWLPLEALSTSRFLYKATVQEASDSRSARVVFQTLSAHTGAQGAASCLLTSILYACGTVLYEPQPAGPPTCNAISSIPRAIYDAGQAGQLIACPHCGWPVLKKTAGTMPYCRDSHRTRFNEDRQVAAARKLLAEGKGWTEIKREIPTITNKLYKKALEKQEA